MSLQFNDEMRSYCMRGFVDLDMRMAARKRQMT